MNLLPATYGLDLDALAQDGLTPNDTARSSGRTMLTTAWDSLGPTGPCPRAVTGSPMPFANPTMAEDVASVHTWEKTRSGWTSLGRMPRTWLDGSVSPRYLTLVRFGDGSTLVFKRHPRKNGAGDNTSFLLIGSVIFNTDGDFAGDVSPESLDTLWSLFDKDTPSLLNLRRDARAQDEALAPCFGTLSLAHKFRPELKAHDDALFTLGLLYSDFLNAHFGQSGVKNVSLDIIGRRFLHDGTRTPFLLGVSGFVGWRVVKLDDVPFLDTVTTHMTALSNSLHPYGGVVTQPNGQDSWIRFIDEQTEPTRLSAHDMMALTAKLKDALQ